MSESDDCSPAASGSSSSERRLTLGDAISDVAAAAPSRSTLTTDDAVMLLAVPALTAAA